MQLTDFFHPIDPFNLAYFIFSLLAFEISGNYLAEKFHAPSFLRPVHWLFGLGIWVFAWFILHFFLPFKFGFVFLSLTILFLLPLKYYLKNKKYLSIFKILQDNKWFILSILIIFPFLIVKSSEPPYQWDEVAYHYYSPAKLNLETVWNFYSLSEPNVPGFYQNLPRGLETAFLALFSLANTYVGARLLHISILITGIFAVSLFIKQVAGTLSSVGFYFLSIFFWYGILHSSSWGTIDTGTATLIMLGTTLNMHLILTKDIKILPNNFIFFGLALGAKYTALPVLITNILAFFAIFLPDLKKLSLKLVKKSLFYIILGLILFLIFGGYWYLKNFLLTKNPLYPFYLPCQIEKCMELSQDITWGHPLDFKVWAVMFEDIFWGNFLLLGLFFFSFVVGLLNSSDKIRKIALFLLILSILELLSLFFIQKAFFVRYVVYWWFYISFAISLTLTKWTKPKILKIISFLVILSVVISTIFAIYDSKRMRSVDIRYAARRMSIEEWNHYYFPEMHKVVSWCGEKRSMTDLYILDPGLIWDSGESLFRGLLINCNLKLIPFKDKTKEEMIDYVKNLKGEVYIATIFECGRTDYPGYGPDKLTKALNEANQNLICQSKKVVDHLYVLTK